MKKTKRDEEILSHYGKEDKLNKYGELLPSIHEPVKKEGKRFYSRHGKEFYFLEGPEGEKPKRMELTESVAGRNIWGYVNDLIRRGKLELPKGYLDNLEIREGEIPYMKKEGNSYEYGGVKVGLNDERDLIIVDKRLSEPEKIATLVHELVHRGGYDFEKGYSPTEKEIEETERKTQKEAIKILRTMERDFPELIKKDYDSTNLEPKLHAYENTPGIFREALRYAVKSRKSFDITLSDVKEAFRSVASRGLERKLGIFLIVMGLTFGLFNFRFTGAVIGTNFLPANWGFILGLVFVLGGVLVLIGGRKLESIVGNVGEIQQNRNNFIRNHYLAYKEYLEQMGKMPRGLNEKQKIEFAKKRFGDSTEPPIEYNNRRAIEFSEYFGSTPLRDRVPIPGDEGREMKTRVYFEISEPLLKAITEAASKDSLLWEASNRKIYDLTKTGLIGSFGKTFKYVPDTDNRYLYLRDISTGARIFLRKLKNNEYDLIGIAKGTQKKKEEEKMIKRIQEIYQSELKNRKYSNNKEFS
jgi:hypothetical protein